MLEPNMWPFDSASITGLVVDETPGLRYVKSEDDLTYIMIKYLAKSTFIRVIGTIHNVYRSPASNTPMRNIHAVSMSNNLCIIPARPLVQSECEAAIVGYEASLVTTVYRVSRVRVR